MRSEQITHGYGEKFDMLNVQFISGPNGIFILCCRYLRPADTNELQIKKKKSTLCVEAASQVKSVRPLFPAKPITKIHEHLAAHNLGGILQFRAFCTSGKSPERSHLWPFSFLYVSQRVIVVQRTIAIDVYGNGVPASEEALQFILCNTLTNLR